MPPKRELSQGQIEEIRALQGQLSAAEAKKHFGIGSTRLYKIWRDESGVAPQQPADPPLLAPPDPTLRRSTQNLLPYGDVVKQQQQAPSPTVEDFYKSLEGPVPSRALYETAGGGAGPVGKQQHPRRLSRRAGGCCKGTSHHSVKMHRHAGGGPP